jgi:outer membrane cobalamin receptor
VPLTLILALTLVVGQVTGTVRSGDGTPVAGARVSAIDPPAPPVATDATGTFSLSAGLPVVVEISAPGFATRRVRLDDAAPAVIVLAPATFAESVFVAAESGNVGPWRDPASGRTTLLGRDIEQLPAVTLDEALRVVSGFSLFRRSTSRAANPTTHGVTLRGLSASGASRGVVLLDGVPLNDGFGGWVTWTRLPAAAISRVDIDRGLHGDAFGSDAVGGVIRIVTPVVGELAGRSGSIAAEAGSQGVGAVDGAAAFQDARVSLFGAGSWFTTDGTVPIEPESQGAVDRPTDADWANGFGRVGILRSGRRLVVSGWGGRDDRGNGTVVQRNTATGGTIGASFDAAGRRGTLAARVSHSPNGFTQTFTAVNDTRTSEFLTNTQQIDTGVTRAIVEAGRSVPDGFVLVRGAISRAGADFEQVRPAGTSLDTVRDDSEAVSVQASIAPRQVPGGRLTANGGFRAEWRAAPSDADGRDSAVVGQIGVALRAGEGVWIRGSAATSHRWPTLNELVRGFRVGDVTTNANPDLAPERSRSVEGAVVVERGPMMVSAGAFHTRVADAIANVTLPSLTGIVRERRNAGDVESTGLELDVEYRRLSNVRLRGSLTVVNSTFGASDEPGIEGNRVPQVPRASGTLSADALLPRRVTASVVWRSASSQFDDDRNVFELAPAHQLDARVAGRVGRFEWKFTVENLFDQRIEVGRTPLVTLAPGRAARFGVGWRY